MSIIKLEEKCDHYIVATEITYGGKDARFPYQYLKMSIL